MFAAYLFPRHCRRSRPFPPLPLLGVVLLLTSLAAAEPEEALSPAPAAAVSRDYRIATRDMIHFQVFEDPEVLVVQRVTANGDIRLPLIGTVNVVGLTLREAEARLRQRFIDEGYYVDPQVILSLQEYTQRSISVLGQVNRPDQVEFPPETNSIGLVQAITYAGGLTRLAKSEAIQVVRTDADGEERRFTVDLTSYLGQRQDGSRQVELLPGDIVFVPERRF